MADRFECLEIDSWPIHYISESSHGGVYDLIKTVRIIIDLDTVSSTSFIGEDE